MKEWIRPLAAALIPFLAALRLSFSSEIPLSGAALAFVVIVFLPYMITALVFHAYAKRKNKKSYRAYLNAGFISGIVCATGIAVFLGFQDGTSFKQAFNVLMILLPAGLIYSAILASFFWAWVVNPHMWPRIISTIGVCILLFPYTIFSTDLGDD